MELTLAEELLLLALHDAKGSVRIRAAKPGLAGALLADLGRSGGIRVASKKIEPTSVQAHANPTLVRALATIAGSKKPRPAAHWIKRLPVELRPIVDTLAQRLVDQGVLGRQRKTLLGLFPTNYFPTLDHEPERLLRERLRTVLVDGAAPTEQDALLIGLLVPLNLIKDLVNRQERKQAKARAKEVADTGVPGNAVHDAVQQEIMAVIVPVLAAAAAGSAGSDGGGGGGS